MIAAMTTVRDFNRSKPLDSWQIRLPAVPRRMIEAFHVISLHPGIWAWGEKAKKLTVKHRLVWDLKVSQTPCENSSTQPLLRHLIEACWSVQLQVNGAKSTLCYPKLCYR